MISELSVKNVAVIEKLHIDLKKGMSVLTGETGAGKSIIIDSINMILGNKTDKGLVRYGEDKASAEAVFDIEKDIAQFLEQRDIECEEDRVIVTRTVSSEGKSTCRVNGTAVPLSFLREIAPKLVNIHGQHDNQALLTRSEHITFLDAFASTSEDLAEYKKYYKELNEAKKKLSSLFTDDDERQRRLEFLEYQINEIEKAELKEDEEEELKNRKKLITDAEKITAATDEAHRALYSGEVGNAYEGIYTAVKAIERIIGTDERIDKAHERLNDILYTVEDISEEISDFAQTVEYSEQELNDIEERLDVYYKLKRKYGETVAEIEDFYEKATAEYSTLEKIDESIEKTEAEIAKIEKNVKKYADVLSKKRKEAAKILESRIEKSLKELNMEQSEFKVQVSENKEFSLSGCDSVEFLIKTNAGEPLKPLTKIASGGELSRVMLAMKSVLAECDGVDTLIFDEIDTGVSGSAAQKIADKLSEIGRFKQVICITHLPQLASMADNHYYIEKNTAEGKTQTTVRQLSEEERIDEVARITGGEITEISRQHAKELLKKAGEKKCAKSEK